MNAPLDPVAAALAAAAAAAAATPVSTQQAVAVAQPAPGAGGNMTVAQPAAALSMENLMAGGMSVEGWFKPKEYGLQINDVPGLVNDVPVIIDMTDGVGFISKMAIKGGNPAQYKYTTDMVNCATGGSWAAAQAEIRGFDPKASPYRCVDLPFTLLADVAVVPPGAVAGTTPTIAAKAGQRLGYTTSTTNWANWEQFYREVVAAGLLGKRVHALIGSQRRTNKSNNVWGVMSFKLVGEVEADDAE